MKKHLTYALAAVIALLSLGLLSGCTAKVKTFGDYDYQKLDNGTLQIVRYTGAVSDTEIPSEIDGRKVTVIGDAAFQGSLDVAHVVIPETVEKIGDYAFECCPNLAAVYIPDSVREIGKGSFSGCTGLREVSGTDGVVSYGDGAFFYCSGIESFTFAPTVRQVGDFMLAECGRLRSVTLNEGLDEISDRMFYNCQMLTGVNIPDSVKRVGDYAFRGCDENFEGITGGANVEYFGNSTVKGFMSEYTLSDKLTRIVTDSMTGAYCLESINIPASVKEIEPNSLPGFLSHVTVDESSTDFIAVDDVVYTKDMKTLVFYAPNSPKTKFAIPEGVEKIAPYAFHGCVNLVSISIPETVTSIGDHAFCYCSTIEKLTVPDSVTTLGESCFDGCGISQVIIGSGVTEIPEGAFANNFDVKTITLPESITKIGARAFANTRDIVNLTIPSSVTEFDATAMAGLECPLFFEGGSLVLENGVLFSDGGKKLVKYMSDSDMTAYTVPDGVESIGAYAFAGTKITSLTVPDSVTEMGECAFGYSWRSDELSVSTDYVLGAAVFGSESSPVRNYCKENDVAFFTGEPSQNEIAVTLEGKDTFKFEINGAASNDVCFTSADPAVASVDSLGNITAHKKGETGIVASIGTVYFKCDVTVTSDGKENYNAYDSSDFTVINRGESAQWVEDYKEFNKDNLSFDPDDNRFTACYKGENYYEGMWAAQLSESDLDTQAVNMFGEGFRDQLAMMDHGLNVELARYKMPSNTVLYSGTGDFSRFIGGKPSTVKNMQEAIGTITTEPYFFSTAVDHVTAQNFGGTLNCVFELYADKELVNGGYIECTVGNGDSGEYELLFPGGMKFEILDAGVREVTVTTLDPMYEGEDAQPKTSYERFMKIRMMDNKIAEHTPLSAAQWAMIAVLGLAALIGCALMVKKNPNM